MSDTLELVKKFIKMNPDSLSERDPDTDLCPFMQATAVATTEARNCSSGSFPEDFSLSVVYLLLRESPSLVQSAIK